MPITSASTTIEPPHLAARRAERPQRRELARPLRDRDRERVRDHERADEERDPAEREQEVLQEVEEALGVLRVLLRLRLAGPDLRVAAAGSPRISAASFAGVTPGFAFARIWSSLPTRWKSRCAGRQVEAGERRAAEARTRRRSGRGRRSSCASVGPFACTPIVCPTCRSFLCAVAWSITTWFGPGQFPSTSVSELSSGRVGSTLKPRFGAPPKATTLPFDR